MVNDLVRWSGDGKVGDKEAWEESCGSSQGTGMKRDIWVPVFTVNIQHRRERQDDLAD